MSSWFKLQALAFDKPVPHRNLLIYPVLMEKYFEFQIAIQSLLLEKNRLVEGITKSHLEYIYHLLSKDKEDSNLMRLDMLLKLCLRKESPEIIKWFSDEETGKPYFIIENDKYDIDNASRFERYDSKDIDILRLLICEQNAIELPDEKISPEVRDSMEEARRLRMRMSGTVPPTLEDMIVCVIVSTGLTLEDIKKTSIRKFGQILQRVDSKLHYQAYLTASLSGMVEFKDKKALKHWMSGAEENKWENTISVEAMKGKLAFDDKKKKI